MKDVKWYTYNASVGYLISGKYITFEENKNQDLKILMQNQFFFRHFIIKLFIRKQRGT